MKMLCKGLIAGLVGCCSFLAGPSVLCAAAFSQVGGGPAHLGIGPAQGPVDLSQPRFAITAGIEWANQTGVAVAGCKVVALASDVDGGGPAVIAVNEVTGQIAWSEPIPVPVLDSWSWPSIDVDTGTVLVAAGEYLTAFDLENGSGKWQFVTPGNRSFVNVSPTVAGGMVYLADFGAASTLYAIDVTDGEALWQRPVGKVQGANTVAVQGGRVLLGTSDGRFRTFDAVTGDPLVDVLLDSDGFFGGVAAEDLAAYLVTYDFYSLATLYKVDPDTGGVIWTAPAPRTDSIPVVTDDMVIVSGGDDYSNGVASVWAYDKGNGQVLWSTQLAGGWNVLAVCAERVLYVATLADWFGEPGDMLYAFDLDKMPGQAGFVVATTTLIGNSAVVVNGNLYGSGLGGLVAFGPVPTLLGDINKDGSVNLADLLLLAEAWGTCVGDPGHNPDADLNGDGCVNLPDLLLLAENWGQSI